MTNDLELTISDLLMQKEENHAVREIVFILEKY